MSWEIFWLFLKVNLLSTSGLVSIGLLHTELVGVYLTQGQFVEAVGLTSILPGSEALKLALFLGYRLGGLGGAAAALLGAILPPTVLIGLLVVLLNRFRHQAWISRFVDGLTPAISALMLFVALEMFLEGGALPDWRLAVLALGSGYALVRGASAPLVLLGAGLVGIWWFG